MIESCPAWHSWPGLQTGPLCVLESPTQKTSVVGHGGHHAATVIHVCLHHGLFHGARLRQLHRCHPLQGDAKQK